MGTNVFDHLDYRFLRCHHLGGNALTVTITGFELATFEDDAGDAKPMPVIKMKEHRLGLGLNKTNATTICGLFGSSNLEDWVGRRITLYPTETSLNGHQVPCIRVRPQLPPATEPDNAEPKCIRCKRQITEPSNRPDVCGACAVGPEIQTPGA